MGKDSEMESRMTAWEWEGWGVEGSSRKEKDLMDTNSSVVTVAGGRWVKVEEGIRRTNSNGKKYNTK